MLNHAVRIQSFGREFEQGICHHIGMADSEKQLSTNPPALGGESVSVLLRQLQEGDAAAREALFRTIYDQLRKMAQGLMRSERSDHTLQASALVHEAYLNLIQGDVIQTAENRRHLFGAAARAMRQVLIDHARGRAAKKRGGQLTQHPLDEILHQFETTHEVSFMDLESALHRLQAESPRQHEALQLRFFAGLTIPETAEVLGCAEGTVETDWRMARAKLHLWLAEN